MNTTKPETSERLRSLTAEIRKMEQELKQQIEPDDVLLQDFRSALDDARMTAWTVSEVQHARKAGKDPGKVLSFLTAERVRRITQMTNDLCSDLRKGTVSLKSSGMLFLADGLRGLLFRLESIDDRQKRSVG